MSATVHGVTVRDAEVSFHDSQRCSAGGGSRSALPRHPPPLQLLSLVVPPSQPLQPCQQRFIFQRPHTPQTRQQNTPQTPPPSISLQQQQQPQSAQTPTPTGTPSIKRAPSQTQIQRPPFSQRGEMVHSHYQKRREGRTANRQGDATENGASRSIRSPPSHTSP